MSANAIQIPRDGYVIGRIENAASDQHPLAGTEIDRLLIYSLEPWMVVPIGKEEKQALDLHARAVPQHFLQPSRAQIADPAEQGIDLFESVVVGQLVKQFEYCSLRRRQRQRPIPLAPILLCYVSTAEARHIQSLPLIDIPFETPETMGNRIVFEEPAVIVVSEFDFQGQLLDPGWWRFGTVRKAAGLVVTWTAELTTLQVRFRLCSALRPAYRRAAVIGYGFLGNSSHRDNARPPEFPDAEQRAAKIVT
jgi:hypothetical protein